MTCNIDICMPLRCRRGYLWMLQILMMTLHAYKLHQSLFYNC